MFSLTESDKGLQAKFSSNMQFIGKFVNSAKNFIDKFGVSNYYEFQIVLRELLTNAVEHGNKMDTTRSVSCSVEHIADRRFKLTVEDEGAGFDFDKIDLNLPADPVKMRYQGLVLVNSFADEITFDKNGAAVTVLVTIPATSKVYVVESGEWRIVTINGDITASNVDQLRKLLDDLFEGNCRKLRFNMANVSVIDSLGLGLFVVLANMVRKDQNANWALEIVDVSKDLGKLFHLTHLDQVYKVAPAVS